MARTFSGTIDIAGWTLQDDAPERREEGREFCTRGPAVPLRVAVPNGTETVATVLLLP
jgi:hypothetical protein